MKVRYYEDTDTLFIELTDAPSAETCDLDENTILDFDAGGNICAIHRRARFAACRGSGFLLRARRGRVEPLDLRE